MLFFSNLDKLQTHHNYLSTILGQKQFFFVGGLIRDLLISREIDMNDVDVTMPGTHPELSTIIKQYRQKNDHLFSFFETEKYGTMTLIPRTDESHQTQYEITPFRTETSYSDGRHPDKVVWSNSLVEDSKRRDFTINAMYYTRLSDKSTNKALTPETITEKEFLKTLTKEGRCFDGNSQTLIIQNQELIEKIISHHCDYSQLFQEDLPLPVIHLLVDPHRGIQDLVDKKIKCVGNPDQRFTEDSLRLIRGLRFAITLQYDLEKTTRNSLKKNAYRIRQVAKERIKQELDKVFRGNNPFGFVALLDETNMLKWIFPKLYDNKGVNQPIRYHPFDVYTHSMMVLYHAQQLSDDYLLRYAALYHDVGKVEQYTSYAMNLDTEEIREMFGSWLNHPICGAEFVQEDFRALSFSNKEIEQIERLVRRHMKPGEILNGDLKSQRKKTRALIAEVGPERVKELAILTIADRLGQYNPIQPPEIESVYGLMDLVDNLMEEEGRFTMKQLAVNGLLLMKEFDLSPSPELGILLQSIFERVCDNIADRNNPEVIVEWVKQQKKIER